MSENPMLRRWIGESVSSPDGDGEVAQPVQRGGDEAGAVLILALLFLVVVGLLVGGLTSWTANDLGNTLTFQQARSSQYALSSATQVAIQSIRYTPLLASGQTVNASPPSYCWGTAAGSDPTYGGSELTTQGDPVNVYCSTVWNPTSATTRIVTVSACLQLALQDVVPAPTTPAGFAAACAATPGLQTIVTFDDYSSANPVISQGQCVSTCGNGMTINSSISHTNAPTVTGLSSTNGPAVPVATGGQNILTVSGTGFVSGATTVSFVGTSASLNLILAGTGVSVASPTSLSVTIPAATTVVPYYVIVTTANGSSPPGPASTYTYNPVLPTVSGIATSSGGSSGSSSGGTSLVITGTGFLSNLSGDSTVVDFIDTANASNVLQACAQPGSTATPNCTSYLTVNSSTQITATTPADPYTDLTFYVTVTTAPGGSSGSTGPVFTYQPFDPVVASVSPNTGSGPQSVTITGIGFVTGATTVTLVPTTGTGTLTATAVSVTNSTNLTATVPAGGHNNTVYNVEVTTPGGNSGTGGPANQYTY
jgi:hypothetical protein